MNFKSLTLGGLVAAASSYATTTMAETAEADKSWTATTELGAIFTSGNTDTVSLVGKLNLEQDFTKWKHVFIADALFKEDEVEIEEEGNTLQASKTTAEKYFASFQTDYKLKGKNNFLFGYGSYTHDRFAGQRKNKTVAVGYGQDIFNNQKVKFKGEIGPGYTWFENQDGAKHESGIARVAGDLKWQINGNAKFLQTLSMEKSFEDDKNLRTKSETALTTKINDTMRMKFAVAVLNNSEVADGFENTDTETTITFVYSL